MASAPATTRYRPAQLVTATIITAAWMAALSVVVLSFGYGGAAGLLGAAELPARGPEAPLLDAFSLPLGTASLLISLTIVAGVQLLPRAWMKRFLPDMPLGVVAGGLATLLGVVLALASVLRFAWWIWVAALLLSLLTRAVLALHAGKLGKPWRLAGISVAGMLFLTWSFQIFGGSGMGMLAVLALTIAGAVLLIAAGVGSIVFFRRADPEKLPETGAHPVARLEGVRAPERIRMPWPCHVLFGLLGAVLALAQPMVWSLQVGQAGFAFIVLLVLIGWAIGFELGPTIAPGMSRPRVTAFALLGAGFLTGGIAFVHELTATAIFSGAAAVLVGIGVRAQDYDVSRRIGFSIGIVISLLIVLVSRGGTLALSEYVAWPITPVDVSLLAIGAAALLAGVVALLRFDPRGTTGLGVDLMYAFQPRAQARRGPAEGLVGAAERTHPQGAFIVFEGGDGVGKSTQVAKLATFLVDRCGVRVEVTREPGGTEVGRQIRSVLLDGDDLAPRAEALLYAADRGHHVSRLIAPALERGEVVISDRYLDSSLAYQSGGRTLSVDEIKNLSLWAAEGLVPHLTVLLDLDPAAAAARLGKRGEADRIEREGESFHARVRQAFLELANSRPGRYLIVDASQHEDTIAGTIREAVLEVLAAHGLPLPPDDARNVDDYAASRHDTARVEDLDETFGEAPAAHAGEAGHEAETTVLPPATEPAENEAGEQSSHGASSREDRPGGDLATAQHSDEVPPGEAETTVQPATDRRDTHGVPPERPSAGELPEEAGELPLGRPEHAGDDAATTVLPSTTRSAPNQGRARLLAQAKLEREARERLRRARDEGEQR